MAAEAGAFEYRISNGHEDVLLQQTTDLGTNYTAVPTNALSLIDVTVSGTGGTFRFNQTADGTNAATTFTAGINAIGARSTSGLEYFVGQICEIDIYNGVLTPTQISAVESAITNSYITPIPSAPVLSVDTTASPSVATVGGNEIYSAAFIGNLPISYHWQFSVNSDGSGSSYIAGATNNTLVLTNLQISNNGYYSLKATNSIAPYAAIHGWVQLNVQPLSSLLQVQLMATNYDPSSGVWTDSSGNGNNASYGYVAGAPTVLPTLVPMATPNGASAVGITTNNGSFAMNSSLAQGSGYTVFAYFMPTNTSGRGAITGGDGYGALEYDVTGGYQDYLIEYTSDVGHGNTNIPTTSFSMIDLAVNSSGASLRVNGFSDANVSGATFTQPITRIANNPGGGDGLVGQVAEIDIYSGVLSYIQITNIEAQLTAKYATANTIVIGAATVSPTNNTFAGNLITLGAPVIGATPPTTFQWQTDNASGGASYSNIGGATTTNYVFDTTGLNGTYLLQLIGTPFGGSSVTSAPVTLTVQPASAPVVVNDTAANPGTATVGGNDTLTASFTGTLPIRYQWQVSANASGIPATSLTAQTNTTLVLSNLQLSDSGKYYSLQASNAIAPNVVNSTWLKLAVQPLTALVQLIATNYDSVSGVWTNSADSNNNATYSGGTTPTLDSVVTPDGSSAVNVISGGGSFALASSLDPSNGYTVLAYVKPTTVSGGGRYAIVGGAATGALEYNFYQGHQNYLIEWTGGGGPGTATIPTTSFSLIDLAVNSAGGAFRLNGASDGSVAGATFSQPIALIGNNHGGGDGYTGDIAEIDIYSGVLSSLQITNLEAQLVAKYGVVGVATNPTNITSTVSGNVLSLTWPADHIGWHLQVQTNSLTAGLVRAGRTLPAPHL